MYDDICIVIPSYEPNEKMIDYVRSLFECGMKHIVVVNDGSSKEYNCFFDEAQNLGAKVLGYEINKGKGYALKTAFSYIKNEMKSFKTIVTADSDGQHTVKDLIKVIDGLNQNRDCLILGSRDFNLSHVPFKSKFGNKTTSIIFKIFYGQYLPDTQTGLRAFDAKYLEDMIDVKGSRFEYEMNMLIYFSLKKYPIKPVIIETIYENNNEGTHFNPIKDSIKIYKVIFSNIFKFVSSSLISTLLDLIAFSILIKVFYSSVNDPTKRIFLAGFIARAISSMFNFLFNKKFVFNINSKNMKNKSIFFKYILVVLFIITCSNTINSLLHLLFKTSEIASKPVIDVLLFFASYNLQKNWVFANKTQTENLDKE